MAEPYGVSLDEIRIDGGTQARAAINNETVTEYAEALRAGETLPPVVAFFDGVSYWLADGFHRYHAHRQAERQSIKVEQRDGTKDDAVLYACGANQQHGLRRSNEDKRKAVLMAFETEKFKGGSDNAVAKHCGVSANFVGDVRRSLSSDESENGQRKRVDKHGAASTMKVSNIGRKSPGRPKSAATLAKEAAARQEKAEKAQRAKDGAINDDQLIDELTRKNDELTEKIALLERDDTKKALSEQVEIRRGLEGRIRTLTGQIHEMDKDLQRYVKDFKELRAITRTDSNRDAMAVLRGRVAA